jgi:hypothetical protein
MKKHQILSSGFFKLIKEDLCLFLASLFFLTTLPLLPESNRASAAPFPDSVKPTTPAPAPKPELPSWLPKGMNLGNIPDHGQLTLESSYKGLSIPSYRTELNDTFYNEEKGVSETEKRKVPIDPVLQLKVYEKFFTEVLAAYVPLHLDYGEEHFGRNFVLPFRTGRLNNVKVSLQRAFPEKQFPHFQKFIENLTKPIQQKTTKDSLPIPKKTETEKKQHRKRHLQNLIFNAIHIWEVDRRIAKRDWPEQSLMGLNEQHMIDLFRLQQQIALSSKENRILGNPIKKEAIPIQLKNNLFFNILDEVIEFRLMAIGKNAFREPLFYEFLTALVIYHHIEVHKDTINIDTAAYSKDVDSRKAHLVVKNHDLLTFLSSIDEIPSHEMITESPGWVLNMAHLLHRQAWQQYLNRLSATLVFICMRTQPSFTERFSMALFSEDDFLGITAEEHHVHESIDGRQAFIRGLEFAALAHYSGDLTLKLIEERYGLPVKEQKKNLKILGHSIDFDDLFYAANIEPILIDIIPYLVPFIFKRNCLLG